MDTCKKYSKFKFDQLTAGSLIKKVEAEPLSHPTLALDVKSKSRTNNLKTQRITDEREAELSTVFSDFFVKKGTIEREIKEQSR